MLAAVWSRLGLVSFFVRRLVFRSGLWLDLRWIRAMGLATLSLWRLDFLADVRLVLEPRGFWLRTPGEVAPGDRSVGTLRYEDRRCAASSAGQERQDAGEFRAGRVSGTGARDRTAGGDNKHGKMDGGEASAEGNFHGWPRRQCSAAAGVSYDVCGEYDRPRGNAGVWIVDYLRPTGTSFREREQSAERRDNFK